MQVLRGGVAEEGGSVVSDLRKDGVDFRKGARSLVRPWPSPPRTEEHALGESRWVGEERGGKS